MLFVLELRIVMSIPMNSECSADKSMPVKNWFNPADGKIFCWLSRLHLLIMATIRTLLGHFCSGQIP
jgi:hypothetical protein